MSGAANSEQFPLAHLPVFWDGTKLVDVESQKSKIPTASDLCEFFTNSFMEGDEAPKAKQSSAVSAMCSSHRPITGCVWSPSGDYIGACFGAHVRMQC